MNKKITVTLVAVLVLLLGAFGIKSINNKNVQDGEKTITIEVLSEVDNINKKEEIKTSEEKLGASSPFTDTCQYSLVLLLKSIFSTFTNIPSLFPIR